MRRILLLSFIVLVASVSCFAQLGDILKSAENAVQPSNCRLRGRTVRLNVPRLEWNPCHADALPPRPREQASRL